MKDVYITGSGVYFPNGPINNDEIESYLGLINGKPSRSKERVLKQNGIKTRFYAIDKNQKTTHSNSNLASNAIINAVDNSGNDLNKIQLLATGTTQADLPVPGFASMVHAELNIDKCEVASFQSVCASGIMALKNCFSQIKSEEKENAVCVGSELASRLFKSTQFEAQKVENLSFDSEFLRWMLSDGAGAFYLENKPKSKGVSLKIDWIDLKSHANEFPLCMYLGKKTNKDEDTKTWQDYESYNESILDGSFNLKQDIRMLDKVIQTGVAHYFELLNKEMIDKSEIDWLCCHYSSEMFKKPIMELMEKGGAPIESEKWFSNLSSKGNTGSASIFVMLDELMQSGKLKNGQQILCMVPESGRFITSFMKLTVHIEEGASTSKKVYPKREIEAPELIVDDNPTSEFLVRSLTQIWIDFEGQLLKTPIIKKIHDGSISLEDYKLLLHDLRQQVIDGSQWISRAASNIDIELFDLRSAFIKHTAAEHKDYQMLEKNYVNLGEEIEQIQTGNKNIGSLALTSFMFNQASKSNPIDLLGAMFIIEGIGKRLAGYWGEMIKDQLNLDDDQVSFFTYHSVADENHFHKLEEAINHPAMNMYVAEAIVKTAKTTASLYVMQFNELGNY